MVRFVSLALLCASASAFTSPALVRQPIVTSPVARHLILTDAETNALMSKGEDCAAGECSIDDVAGLIAELKETEKALEERLQKIMNMVGHLQHINEKEERKTDDVRQFVKDMLRVFSSDKPIVFPTGFAGDIGKGATTAYDALPPKPWKASGSK